MSEKKKIKILTISDHPLSPSGVGIQTKYFIEALLKTGKYKFICLGGAMKHDNYQPLKTEEWGEDFVIFPVDGYGNQDIIRSVVRNEKPDILWFMTDPRFYEWLWAIENEIRPLVPMVYYHVWDNYPHPHYNNKFYSSNDVVACISKVTYDILQTVSPHVESHYLPHAVNTDIFKRVSDEDIKTFKNEILNISDEMEEQEKVIFFWNNRNARRKQSGTLIWWFKEFLDEVGHDKACLVLHTDPNDEHGQPLTHLMEKLELTKGQVLLSTQKLPPEHISLLYNMSNCTINISDAEGFGLATFESLACETPIIVNMTGGLQEQVTDGEAWFGIGIEPSSKAIIGSQQVPYIYEDRLNKRDFIDALKKIYNMPESERRELGKMGRQHVMKNYNFQNFEKKWEEVMDSIYEKHGSWENRKNYKSYKLIEI